MAKPYASQPLYHSIVLPVSFEHPTAVLVQDMSTNPHTLGLWNIAHQHGYEYGSAIPNQTSCSYLDEVKVWNGRYGSLDSLENFYPLSVEFSCNGEFVASCGWGGTTEFLEQRFSETFAFSPNGELISDWGGGIVRLWDLRVGNIHPLPRKSNLVLLVTIDGATLWDFPTGTPQNQLEALKNPITGPELFGDGRLVAAFAGETIMVWDTGSGKLIRTLELDVDDSDIECYASIKAAFWPDGKIITWALDTLQFQALDPISGKQIKNINGSFILISCEVSHDGYLLAITDHAKVGIRELSTGKHIYLKKSYDLSMRMAFSPNDMTLAVHSKSCSKLTLDVWHVSSCELHCSIVGVTGRYIHFSENGNYTVTEGHLALYLLLMIE
ncbi:hypothetical protein ASPTUDRAFT_923903 [Aspergillus tubingensis CBS 134.48]|uniref:Uncharacterized protein n=1 Tax=Aspergillus tubingensis (strain CBS 134.48) TaxID=767770 RepID=A0A1L9NBU4_ASPTC|nr:hypothetical protein ASPTUDRAFT_923903 [Aspergillus tubingensis CBS 134.48]